MDKIFRTTLFCIGIVWLGFLIYMIVAGPFENNSQEAVGIPITIATSTEEYTISIPEYNKKLDYLWSKLSEKERCRFEEENGLGEHSVISCMLSDVKTGKCFDTVWEAKCAKWLEKTESKYLKP